MKRLSYFKEFISENLVETPETYIGNLLTHLKTKIESWFDGTNEEVNSLGLELETCDLSQYSKLLDNLKIRYNDGAFYYDLGIFVDLESASNKGTSFQASDIKEVTLKFKKYDNDNNNLLAEYSKNINVDKIEPKLLIDIKDEAEGQFKGKDENPDSIFEK
jgi:hypothetical protein